jgi:hypothetical protein
LGDYNHHRQGGRVSTNRSEAILAPTADEIRGLFDADYVEVRVAADGTIQRADDEEVDVATRSLKRERTWYEGAGA